MYNKKAFKSEEAKLIKSSQVSPPPIIEVSNTFQAPNALVSGIQGFPLSVPGLASTNMQPIGTVVTTSYTPLTHSVNNDIILSRSYPQRTTKTTCCQRISVLKKTNVRLLALGLVVALITIGSIGLVVFVFEKIKSALEEKNSRYSQMYKLFTNTTTVITQSWDPEKAYPGIYVARYPLSLVESYLEKNPDRSSEYTTKVKIMGHLANDKELSSHQGRYKTGKPFYYKAVYTYHSDRALPIGPNGKSKPITQRKGKIAPLVVTEPIYTTSLYQIPTIKTHVDVKSIPWKPN